MMARAIREQTPISKVLPGDRRVSPLAFTARFVV